MNKVFAFLLSLLLFANCKATSKTSKSSIDTIPSNLLGDFKDDYNSTYTINDSIWIQHPGIKYHILKYDSPGQYFIAKNDAANPSDANLYTRIDIMYFNNMEPWTWGFCLTAYNAITIEEAVAKQSADRNNPRKGCNGYPFSRMKKDTK